MCFVQDTLFNSKSLYIPSNLDVASTQCQSTRLLSKTKRTKTIVWHIRRVFECIGFMIGKHWATGSALDGCMMFIDWGIRPHNSFIFILCNDCWASSSINMNNKQKRGAACALCGVFFWQFNSHPRIVLLRFWIFILFLSLWTVMLHIFWNGSLLSRTINIL